MVNKRRQKAKDSDGDSPTEVPKGSASIGFKDHPRSGLPRSTFCAYICVLFLVCACSVLGLNAMVTQVHQQKIQTALSEKDAEMEQLSASLKKQYSEQTSTHAAEMHRIQTDYEEKTRKLQSDSEKTTKDLKANNDRLKKSLELQSAAETTAKDLEDDNAKLRKELKEKCALIGQQTGASKAAAPAAVSTPTTNTKPRIDFKSCVADSKLLITANADWLLGAGHRMTQFWFIFYLSMVDGHCVCFQPKIDKTLWHLLLESLFEECPEEAPGKVTHLTMKLGTQTQSLNLEKITGFFRDNVLTALTNSTTAKTVVGMYADSGQVWASRPVKDKRGYGDVLQFVDNIIRDNDLVNSVVMPYYLEKRTYDRSAFVDIHDDNVLNAAVHLRVGDLVIESARSYWENVFHDLERVVLLEYSEPKKVNLHLVYYKGGVGSRGKDVGSEYGVWQGQQKDLPETHNYFPELCASHSTWLQCHWKSGIGTSVEESVDALLRADILYMSGSSFSTMIGMFSKAQIKFVAVAKELNWDGKRLVDFWATHTNVLTTSRYYYPDVDGKLFAQQYAYLGLSPPAK